MQDTRQIDSLNAALADEQARNRRLLAELENVRRRATMEQLAARHRGRCAALLPLVPVLDTLDRAVAAGSTDARFFEGVAATLRLFVDALRAAGAAPFDRIGSRFDPDVHEAAEIVHRGDVVPGTVVGELLKGWRVNGDLLRPARVVVAVGRDESD
jgi:molecular chaperone GrpE